VTSSGSELEAERHRLALLREQLERTRAALWERLHATRSAPSDGTAQWRVERDALARTLEDQLGALATGDLPLCFGRLDFNDGDQAYIGRVGLTDENHDVLLVDWRAPYARPFYTATPVDPQGVRRRRHLLMHGRDVVGIDDEVFDPDLLVHADASLRGEGALMAAVGRARTGRMGDIVATIQAEQDRIVRAPLAGVLVVQGGPGTGKTVVALHRAAYLLYTHRDRLRDNGVLVVGPSNVFLHYIEQVLPSLGETGVLSATPAELYPGVVARAEDSDAAASVKGDERMADVIARAVAARQRVPREPLTLWFERALLTLDRDVVARARKRGRRSERPHNEARRLVEAVLLDELVAQFRPHFTERSTEEPTAEELADIRRSLRSTRAFNVVMTRVWPTLTAPQLLNDLFGSPGLLRSATPSLTDDERASLVRPRLRDPDATPWTAADVALLDEAADRLGVIERGPSGAARAAARVREHEVAYASDLIDVLDLDIPLDAEALVDRYAGGRPEMEIADRAGRDRAWTFGHVIVDEAQELSAMAWRMIFRRAAVRSMTIVGDLAQAVTAGGVTSWQDLIERFAHGRGHVEELTVNYRTPREIMSVAARVLATAAPGAPSTTAIRSSGRTPGAVRTTPGRLAEEICVVVEEQRREWPDGRVAVIAPPESVGPIAAALSRSTPGLAAAGPGSIDHAVAVLTARETKGLEFDVVVLVEPAALVAAGPRGHNDLYVALTRATQHLVVVHCDDLPPELTDLPRSRRV
jgi:DNA helicase IV